MSMITATGTLQISTTSLWLPRILQGDPPAGPVLAFACVHRPRARLQSGVVPFHMWIPDVTGRRLRVTLFISTGPKLAASDGDAAW